MRNLTGRWFVNDKSIYPLEFWEDVEGGTWFRNPDNNKWTLSGMLFKAKMRAHLPYSTHGIQHDKRLVVNEFYGTDVPVSSNAETEG